MSYITSLEENQICALREYLLGNFRAFSHFAFKIQTGSSFIEVDYHNVMFEAIQRLIDQTSNRMLINIPPRAGKTQLISIFLPLFAWVHNPHAHNMLLGYNSDVLHECTGYIRNIMIDPDFIRVFPDVVIDMNKKSVEKLGTMSGGVTHAITLSGKVIGKGAGQLGEGFSGLLCIDDAIKADDAQSPTERDKVNNRYSGTVLSRLATELTPLVTIAQRLHPDDLPGYILKGLTPDKEIEWLNIPGVITKDTGSEKWYADQIEEFGYSDKIKPILYDLDRDDSEYDEKGESSFWPIRKDIKTLQALRDIDPYTFYSQYMGMPRSKGSVLVDHSDFRTYDKLSSINIRYTFITADTASTAKDYSDYSVATLWGVSDRQELILIDMSRGKWEVPELIVAMREFWQKHNVFSYAHPTHVPRGFYMEDSSSGLFLNQQFLRDGTVTVRPLPRDTSGGNDKFTRFLNVVPYIKQGRLLLPAEHIELNNIKREIVGMNEFGNQTGHDDIVDTLSDAVAVAFSASTPDYTSWV